MWRLQISWKRDIDRPIGEMMNMKNQPGYHKCEYAKMNKKTWQKFPKISRYVLLKMGSGNTFCGFKGAEVALVVLVLNQRLRCITTQLRGANPPNSKQNTGSTDMRNANNSVGEHHT